MAQWKAEAPDRPECRRDPPPHGMIAFACDADSQLHRHVPEGPLINPVL